MNLNKQQTLLLLDKIKHLSPEAVTKLDNILLGEKDDK